MPGYIPIWRDTFVDLGAADVAPFTVSLASDQSVIYSGKAVRRPDEATLTVRVNDIVADLLSRNLLSLQDPFTGYDSFIAEVVVQGNGVTEHLTFINDWSYDGMGWGESFILSDPVNGLVDGRQRLAVSGVFEGTEEATYIKNDGTITSEAVGITGAGTWIVNLGTIPDLKFVSLKGETWSVDSLCGEWALHYINAYGGWDTLLMRGGGKRVDSITRYDHRKTYDNSQPVHRGRVNYLNDITTRWELRTGWLSDEAASRMWELTESVLVYLEDIASGVIVPVVVTDSETVFKTYMNQGRKMVDYTVTVELAADRFRK